MVIGVYQNGMLVGFVKSISTYNYKFSITKQRENAKKYKDYNALYSDIDLCQKMSGNIPYGFSAM